MTDKLQSILQAEGLEHLLPVFKDQGVTDSILEDLSADDLRDLGIDKIGERKRLLIAFSSPEVDDEEVEENSDEDSDEDSDDHGPDLVTDQLVGILLKNTPLDFGQLFDQVHEGLRAKNATSGSEEMLRLRTYEKLQNLVSRGLVKKAGDKYAGLASLSNALFMESTAIDDDKHAEIVEFGEEAISDGNSEFNEVIHMKNVIEYYEIHTGNEALLVVQPSIPGFPYDQLAERISHWNTQGFRVSIMTPAIKGGVDVYHTDSSHDVGHSATCGLFVCYEKSK